MYLASSVKAKFHYAIWFEAGSKLVADRFKAGRRNWALRNRVPAPLCSLSRDSCLSQSTTIITVNIQVFAEYNVEQGLQVNKGLFISDPLLLDLSLTSGN